MHKIFFYAFGLVILAGAIILTVFYFTQNLTNMTDRFFSLLQQQKFEEAYQSTAAAFRANTTLEQFQAYMEQSGLIHATGSTWNSRSIGSNQGTLEGTVSTSSGGSIPLKVFLVKEEGDWKILRIEQNQAGLQNTSQSSLPGDEEISLLVQGTIFDFIKAVGARDFSTFYENISELWRAQSKPDDFKALFQEFIDKNIDFTFVSRSTMVLNQKPFLDERGVLVLEGSYPSENQILNFRLKYIYEHPAWKLMGIEVKGN